LTELKTNPQMGIEKLQGFLDSVERNANNVISTIKTRRGGAGKTKEEKMRGVLEELKKTDRENQ
jgi:hypothetical protein